MAPPPENKETKLQRVSELENKEASVTWNARDLNTEVSDSDDIVSLADNQFTQGAGDYRLTMTPDGKTTITKTK